MSRSRRLPVGILMAIVATIAMAASTFAAPSEESCAAYRAVPFSTPVPDAMRTLGRHRFEWYSTWTNPDGSVGEAFAENEINIDATAPLYPNNVFLRLVRNFTLSADGEVLVVSSMRPDQAAIFYAAAFGGSADQLFLDTFRTWHRYETSRNHWTPWTEIQRGPVTSFCNQVTTGTWKRTYGWD